MAVSKTRNLTGHSFIKSWRKSWNTPIKHMHIPSWYQSAFHPLSLGLNWVQCIMDNPLRWIKMLRREWKSDVLEMLLIKKCNFLCVWVCERKLGWKESCISKQQQMPLLSFKHSASLFCSKGTSRSRIHIIKPNKWLLYLAAGLSRQAQPIIETQSRAVMSFWKTLEGGKCQSYSHWGDENPSRTWSQSHFVCLHF